MGKPLGVLYAMTARRIWICALVQSVLSTAILLVAMLMPGRSHLGGWGMATLLLLSFVSIGMCLFMGTDLVVVKPCCGGVAPVAQEQSVVKAVAQRWFTVQELAGLPGMPGTERGVLRSLQRNAVLSRPKARGKGREYALEGLPAETQQHLCLAMAAALAADRSA